MSAHRKPAPVAKKPFFFGLALFVFMILQVGGSYFSIRSFLEGDLLEGFAFFLLVLFLGFLIARSYTRFRDQHPGSPENTSGDKNS